jgi:hypothetical protein
MKENSFERKRIEDLLDLSKKDGKDFPVSVTGYVRSPMHIEGATVIVGCIQNREYLIPFKIDLRGGGYQNSLEHILSFLKTSDTQNLDLQFKGYFTGFEDKSIITHSILKIKQIRSSYVNGPVYFEAEYY